MKQTEDSDLDLWPKTVFSDHGDNQQRPCNHQFAIGRFECAAVFIVRSMNAIGWRAPAAGLGKNSVERLSLPLGGASIFQAAHDSRKLFRGRRPFRGHTLARQLWSHFPLKHEPEDLHVVPITGDDRVVNLIYAHGFPSTRPPTTSTKNSVS